MVAPSLASRASAAEPAKSHAAAFDKTRFALHLGAAFFAVHHVYKRYQQGAFKKGAPHRTRTIIANGALLLIGYHEAKVAYGIAQRSNSKTLHALIAPLNAFVGGMGSVGNRLHSGQYSARDVSTLDRQANLASSASTSAGYIVKDQPMALPAAA